MLRAALRRLDRHPRLAAAVEALPVPVGLPDGTRRPAPVKVWRLTRVWSAPEQVAESEQARAAYAGGDVLDVGAFEGWYALLLAPRARPGDRLVCFEPDRRALPQLLAVLAAVARLYPAATPSVVTTPVGDGGPVAAERLEGTPHPRFGRGAPGDPPTLALDAYVAAAGLRPRFVKVDVEGAEWFVLRGMAEILRVHRPVVLLELHPRWQPEGVTAADVEALLRDAGYAAEALDDSGFAVRQLWRPAPG